MHDIGLIEGLPVYVNHLVLYLDRVSGKAYTPLHEILFRLQGIVEDDHVLSVGPVKIQYLDVSIGDLYAVRELRHEEKIPGQKGILHGSRGDLISLNEKGPDDQDHDDGPDQRLEPGFHLAAHKREV